MTRPFKKILKFSHEFSWKKRRRDVHIFFRKAEKINSKRLLYRSDNIIAPISWAALITMSAAQETGGPKVWCVLFCSKTCWHTHTSAQVCYMYMNTTVQNCTTCKWCAGTIGVVFLAGGRPTWRGVYSICYTPHFFKGGCIPHHPRIYAHGRYNILPIFTMWMACRYNKLPIFTMWMACRYNILPIFTMWMACRYNKLPIFTMWMACRYNILPIFTMWMACRYNKLPIFTIR